MSELTTYRPSQVPAKGVERDRALEGQGGAAEVGVSREAVEVVEVAGELVELVESWPDVLSLSQVGRRRKFTAYLYSVLCI